MVSAGASTCAQVHAYQGKDSKVVIVTDASSDASATAAIEVIEGLGSTRRIVIYHSALVLRALASSDGRLRIAPGVYTAGKSVSIESRTAVDSLESQKQRHLRSGRSHLAWVDRGLHDAGQPC